MGVWAPIAKAGDLAVDELRIDIIQGWVIAADAFGLLRSHPRYKNIDSAGQLPNLPGT